ncbi:MAG: sugar ABC transporter substrate-binding protein [Verrucomicrobiae bacterium]|nr:sugar ABC transporter substrate-binding protein [Verrucomicrobiae bacterium]
MKSSSHPALLARRRFLPAVLGLWMAVLSTGCGRDEPSEGATATGTAERLTVGIAFETLQTEYWVAGYEALKSECARRGFKVLEAVADGDANRQLEQVKNFITRRVDGIILVPKDAKTCLPAIRAANAAGIPIVLFNRPAAQSDATSVAVVADNPGLARATVDYMIGEARKTGRKHQAMILMGDLGDINAIGRRDGFDAAVAAAPDVIEVVSRIPTEWNQEKAQAGVVNGLQANPGIRFIFSSSDFLFPSIVSALKAAGKYHRIGDPGHVILGGIDGDATAWQMLQDGYLDATGVQDVYFEAAQSVEALVALREGRDVASVILDPGFVIHQGNFREMAEKTWGANVGK